MSASKILALTTLFLAMTFAQTEWKEFISSDGNFRVLFPDNPQQQTGTERNLHQLSATAGDESYGRHIVTVPSSEWTETGRLVRATSVISPLATVKRFSSTVQRIGTRSVPKSLRLWPTFGTPLVT